MALTLALRCACVAIVTMASAAVLALHISAQHLAQYTLPCEAIHISMPPRSVAAASAAPSAAKGGKRRVAKTTEANSSAPAKPSAKQQQLGNCRCSGCGAKTSGGASPAWARFVVHPRTGVKTPMGDRCKSCDDRYSQLGYKAYMTFEAFIEHEQSELGKKEVSLAAACKDDPSHRNFSLDSVDSQVKVGYKVSKHFLVMNEGEFVATFGGKPHSKMPSAPTMQIRKDNSSATEKVWLFAHPVLRHRTLELFSLHGVAKSTSVLDAASHYHESQGAKVFDYSAEAAAKDSKAKLLSASMRIPDIESYSAAFQKQREEASAKRNRQSKGQGDLEEGDEFLEESMLNFEGDGALAELGHGDVGMSQESDAPDDSAEGLAQMLQDAAEAISSDRHAKEPSFTSPALKRTRTPSVLNDSATVKSATQGSDGGVESSLKKAKRHGPAYYINELPLDKVVAGEKLGVPEHHARLLLKGAAGDDLEPDMIALHNHLDLVEAGKNLVRARCRTCHQAPCRST